MGVRDGVGVRSFNIPLAEVSNLFGHQTKVVLKQMEKVLTTSSSQLVFEVSRRGYSNESSAESIIIFMLMDPSVNLYLDVSWLPIYYCKPLWDCGCEIFF